MSLVALKISAIPKCWTTCQSVVYMGFGGHAVRRDQKKGYVYIEQISSSRTGCCIIWYIFEESCSTLSCPLRNGAVSKIDSEGRDGGNDQHPYN